MAGLTWRSCGASPWKWPPDWQNNSWIKERQPCLQLQLPLFITGYLLNSTCSLLLRDRAKATDLYPLWPAPCPDVEIPTQLHPSSWCNGGVWGESSPSFCLSHCCVPWLCKVVVVVLREGWGSSLFTCLFLHSCFNNKPTFVSIWLPSLSPKEHFPPSSKDFHPRTIAGAH